MKGTTGGHAHHRVAFQRMPRSGALAVLRTDATRVGGGDGNPAVPLLAAGPGVPVRPHAGGGGRCELAQHLSMSDHVAVSGTTEGRAVEYAGHPHERFPHPVVVRDGHRTAPAAPGFPAALRPEPVARCTHPGGTSRAAGPDRRKGLPA